MRELLLRGPDRLQPRRPLAKPGLVHGLLVPGPELSRALRSAGSPVRLTTTSQQRRQPGATFRVDCPCGAFTTCDVTASLSTACSRCRQTLPDGVPARLRVLRPFRGVSIPEVASKVGVTKGTVRDWETGVCPIPSSKRNLLAALLQVVPDLLRA